MHAKEVKVDMTDGLTLYSRKIISFPTLDEVEQHIHEKDICLTFPIPKKSPKMVYHLEKVRNYFYRKIEELDALSYIEQNKLNKEQSELLPAATGNSGFEMRLKD